MHQLTKAWPRPGVLRHQVTGRRAGSDLLARPSLRTGLQGFLAFAVQRQSFGLVEARLALREELMLGPGDYLPDVLICVARTLHGGSSTQVWDATVTRESDGREIGHFRCTQQLLAAQR